MREVTRQRIRRGLHVAAIAGLTVADNVERGVRGVGRRLDEYDERRAEREKVELGRLRVQLSGSSCA